MKFIQLVDGVSVKKDDISTVERLKNGKIKISTATSSFYSELPYEHVMKLLEMNQAYEWQGQYFRG